MIFRGWWWLLGALLVCGAAEPPSRPITLSPTEAPKAGRELVADILSRRPTQNTTDLGILKIRDPKGQRTETPVKFEILVNETAWKSSYATEGDEKARVLLEVTHHGNSTNEYFLKDKAGTKSFKGNEAMIPFAESDFWLADLGLEFFYWPDQRLLKKEIRRGQSCNVLESINPHPKPGTYSRVVSWIDIDSNGIIHADAYDHQGKLLKIFEPNEFKKVRGQWQLQEMEIRNKQTGSRTQIEFKLRSP
jgi:hypothetical protein